MPLHVPLLRGAKGGAAYESVDQATLTHHATGEPVATMSLANPGLIRRDIKQMRYDVLESFKVSELLAIAKRAAKLFMTATLSVGDEKQTFDDYLRILSATTGMPVSYCRNNAAKLHRVLDEMDLIVAGLTRGFDLSILDQGFGSDDGRMLSWFREARVFGAVLPSNSPGVHSLWLPAFALKTPTVLKPGREEPWSPYRLLQALIAAGAPAEAFGFYPADHAGAGEILNSTDRSMLFGDAATTRMWAKDHRVELHGPGYSKVILGTDAAEEFEKYIDVIAASITANGGRSCINASAVWTPKNADKIAHALAAKLATVKPLPVDDPQATIAAFANPTTAERMNAMIDGLLAGSAAEDVTAKLRGSARLATVGRIAYLLPTIIRCERDHGIANREFLFPFATVIECPQDKILDAIGPTLIGTVISKDQGFIRAAMACGDIDRLNVGPVPTYQLSWDQPHEGNLFEHLYRQRAFQAAS